MSIRQVRREIQHAIADLDHEAHPDYAATWQDDIKCAARHLAAANELIRAEVDSYTKKNTAVGEAKP